MTARTVELSGGSPWGFRMHGGVDVNQPLRISRVNPGRKASLSGIREGDVISSINNVPTKSLTNAQAHAMLKNSGDILKLGLNEDSVGSPRRRSVGKANGLELKRPSQLIAEVQGSSTPRTPTLSRPESRTSFTPNKTEPSTLNSNHPSPFASSSNNLFSDIPPHTSQYTSNNSLNQQSSPLHASSPNFNPSVSHSSLSLTVHGNSNQQLSPKFVPSPTLLRKSPFDNSNPFPATQNISASESKLNSSPFSGQLSLRSPSLANNGSSPNKSSVSPNRNVSPFSTLESTSLVKTSIRPSITMPTITPPTISFPSYSSSETNCERSVHYTSHNTLNASTSQTPTASEKTSPRSPFQTANSNTGHTSLGYVTTFKTDIPQISPRSPLNSLPYISGNNQTSSSNQWINHAGNPTSSFNSPFATSSGPYSSTVNIFPKDSAHSQFSNNFPLNGTPTFSNCNKPNVTVSTSPFSHNNILPTINSAPISSTYSSKPRQASTFAAPHNPHNGQTKPPSSAIPTISKSNLSSIQFPHYLLYSTPTTTIRSTNPFVTNEYLITKTEISEQSITETEEVTTTKRLSLNGYEEPSSQAFDKALSAMGINGTYNAEAHQGSTEASLVPFIPYGTAETKPPRTPQDNTPKKVVMIAPTFKAKASSSGVWTPGAPTSAATFNKVTSGNSLPTTSGLQNGGVSPSKALAATQPPTKPSRTESIESQSQTSVRVTSSLSNGVGEKQTSVNVRDSSPSGPPPPPPPPLPVWKPKSQPPSPAQERKEFKPVAFDSPTLARKKLQEQSTPQAPPPWEARLAGSQSAPAAPGLSGLAGPPAPPPPPPPTLPRAQNPTITLLQKAREGQLPRGAAYLQQDREREPPRDRRSPPRYDQGEIVYTLKRDYASDTESGNSRRRMEPKKYEGIGPTTREGMPIVLRSEVKEGNQSKWYKKMYDTIHRNKFDEDYVTVRYKSRRAHPSALHAGPRQTQYAYFDPRSGYLSEPEGGRAGWASDAYDSDASAKPPGRRHSTLDRRGKENEANEYLPNVSKYSTLASAKASQEVYKNQPGRIEDYIPGRSSVVDKEAKQWWDEVMDIFDGQLANASTNHPQINNKQSVSSSAISKSYMARALKESGYESDSTLVFRRRGVTGDMDSAPLSPREQRQAYREVQAGGEPPLHGFRKPAPDRPKDPELAPIPPPKGINSSYLSESPRRYVESDVNIHYRVPVRQEPRPLVPEEELARRQADHMRRVYQEERRRKYLQELQDMNSRRHTDNFTPAQKSPISLNRYDTFGLTGQVRPHQVARALHNFTGQSPRELSFRRGELILVRRRIDQNWFEGEHDGQVGLFPANYVELLDDSSPNQGRPTEGRARAKFNFVAQTHLELGLKKGELVVLVRRVDDNWYEGKLGGRKGIFPVSYVEVLVEPQVNRAELTPSLSSGKPVASPAAHSVTGAAGAASLGAHHYTPQINNPNLSNSPSSTAPLTLPSHGISNHHARPASATLPRASDPSPVNLNNHEPLFVDTNAEAVPYRAMYKYRPQNPDELELQEGDTVYVLEKCDDGWYVGSSQRTGRFGTFPGNYVDKI